MRRFGQAVPYLILAALVVAALGVSLRGGFVWDDAPLIVDNPRVQDPSELGKVFTDSFWETGDRHDRFRSFFRPLVSLSYAADYALWGLAPFGFHLTNLMLHYLCCVLVYRIGRGEGLPSMAALIAGGLFAVHPAHVESVAWISGRTDLLCGLFFLASFASYRTESGSERRPRIGSLALFALALFSKEMAATLPLLVFADRWLRGEAGPGRVRAAWGAAWPYLAVLAGYVMVRQAVLGTPGSPLYEMDALAYAATVVFVLARYVILLVLPVGLDAHYPYKPLGGPGEPLFLVSAAIVALVVAGGFLLWRRRSPGAYWVFWILVSLGPVMALGRFGDVLLADRFLYIPSAGLTLLAGVAAAWAARARWSQGTLRAATAVAAALGLVLAGASYARSRVWRDDHTLFGDMLRTSPDSALVRNNYGLSLYAHGEFASAATEFRMATQLADGYALAHNNLAAALERNGALEEALVEYQRALRVAPGLFEASANAGNLLVRLGHPERGLALLREVVRRHPRSAPALYAFASALDFAGRSDEALPYLMRAGEADPDHAETWYLLGKIRHEQGRDRESAETMRRFLALWPTPGDTHAEAARRILDQAAGS